MSGDLGDDVLSGGEGNDFLFGGLGLNTAVFAGDVRDYQISTDTLTTQTTVKDLAPLIDGDDGTDTLQAIERIQFNNYTVYLDGTDNAVLAVDDTATVSQGVATTISAASLLANDFDFDHDMLVLESVSNPQNGTVTLNASGDVVFTATAGFTGSASFDYVVGDGRGSFDTATVNLAVVLDVPPEAQDDSAITDQDTVLNNGVSVLVNDSDPDAGDILSVSAVNGAAGKVGSQIVLSSGALLRRAAEITESCCV